MADNLQIFKVFCEGGLDTNRDVLSQGEQRPGSAVRLINYEPSLTGGYRRVNGFTNAYPDLPGTGATLGVIVANGIDDGIFACRTPEAGNNYLHAWNTSTDSWDTITTSGSPTMTGVSKIRSVRYNWTGPRILLVDGINPAAYYDGTSYVQITDANAPSDPKYASDFASHMFLSGDSTDPSLLYFSSPLDETDFSPANGAGVINMGFDIVQLKKFRDQLYVFGTNQIKKIIGSSIADFTVEEVTDNLGCVASDSVIEIGGDLLFLGPDGLRPVSGTDRIGDVELETVSKSIQSIVTGVAIDQDLDGLNSVVIRQKSQFRIFFSASESTGVIGALKQNSGGIGFEFGQLLGITATCADSGYIGQEEYVLHGDSDGKVYRQEFGSDFDGLEIFSLFQTPFYHMGDPELRKNFLKVSTYLRSEGDAELAMAAIYDYEDQLVSNPTDFAVSVEGAAAFYNEAVFDGSGVIYDGNPSPVVKTNISGSGTSISLRYVTNDTNPSHSIQGLVLLFGVGDRR